MSELSPHYDAIGRIASSASQLERELHETVGRLTASRTLFYWANGRDLSELIRLVGAARRAELRDDDPRSWELRQLLQQATKLNDLRNEVVHSLWLGGPDQEFWHGTKAMPLKDLKTIGKRPLHQDFERSADELRLIAADLFRLCKCIFVWRWNFDLAPNSEAQMTYLDGDETPHGQCSGWRPTT